MRTFARCWPTSTEELASSEATVKNLLFGVGSSELILKRLRKGEVPFKMSILSDGFHGWFNHWHTKALMSANKKFLSSAPPAGDGEAEVSSTANKIKIVKEMDLDFFSTFVEEFDSAKWVETEHGTHT